MSSRLEVKGSAGLDWPTGSEAPPDRLPKLLCEIHDPAQMSQIQGFLRHFGYGAEEWAPVHEHYADYRQLYLWAEPSAEPQAVAAGKPA